MRWSWTLMFLMLWVHSVAASTATMALQSMVAGAQTLVDVALTTTVAIPVGGSIRVTFPSGFMVTPTAITSPVGLDAASSLSMLGTVPKITIAATAVAAGTVSFTLNGVFNPGVGATSPFDVSTYNATGFLLESATVPAKVITANDALIASVSSNSTAGANRPWQVTVTSAVTLPAGSIMRVTFPARYVVQSVGVLDTTGFGATTYSSWTSGNDVNLGVATFPLVPGTYKYTLQGITNPGSSCNQFYDEACVTAWENLVVSTLDVNGNTFQSMSVPATPIIKSNLRFARVRTALTTPNTVTSAYVLFNTMTVIPVGGHIVVTFPTGFTLSPAGTVMFNNGINSMSTATISGLTVQVTVASSSVAIQNGVKFTLSGVTTPPLHTSGSYQVQTTDSLNNVLEESANIGGVGCRFLNDCSGHGDCTLMSSTCTCHPGFGASSDVAEYKAPDCSVRTCPSDLAWSDIPSSASLAHQTVLECSGRGLCNRTSGTCLCVPGYEGNACQRTSCPNNCSGHGRCLSVSDWSASTSALPLSTPTTYSQWDANRIYGCVCDSSWPVGLGAGDTRVAEWFGADCSLRTQSPSDVFNCPQT
ncbi:hypothetical protein, variant [Aphanomyces astaci]|uniref:EGF-like domain-containing protein n=1 Tax=Aphanomyces astaci TaxID=112090 RepID=W4GZA2_APHAT|nr:hypothetical protein, variant [Aphanomyces astaci]ETV84349.1 hypothetical protein, variant [Aphanomyces astaci]|eukprot:XP_009826041.1 hypothetical protein, variant [Aphanomyces astaci]